MGTPCTTELNDRVIEDAHRLFAKTLAAWAQDLLSARRLGLLSMQWQCEPAEQDDRWSIAA